MEVTLADFRGYTAIPSGFREISVVVTRIDSMRSTMHQKLPKRLIDLGKISLERNVQDKLTILTTK